MALIGAVAARTFRTKKAAVSDEKRPLSTGEGRRTRTFNQRIKSAVAAAT